MIPRELTLAEAAIQFDTDEDELVLAVEDYLGGNGWFYTRPVEGGAKRYSCVDIERALALRASKRLGFDQDA